MKIVQEDLFFEGDLNGSYELLENGEKRPLTPEEIQELLKERP